MYHMWMKLLSKCVISYTEDVLIHGKTELKVQEYTQEIISITQNTSFKASNDENQSVQSEVKYSGIVLGQKGRVILGSSKGRTGYESPCPYSNKCIRLTFKIAYISVKISLRLQKSVNH